MPIALAKIKAKLDVKIGKNLTVTSHLGRKKISVRHGILLETFPAVFLIELDHSRNSIKRVSYSYIDVLTQNIQLDFDVED